MQSVYSTAPDNLTNGSLNLLTKKPQSSTLTTTSREIVLEIFRRIFQPTLHKVGYNLKQPNAPNEVNVLLDKHLTRVFFDQMKQSLELLKCWNIAFVWQKCLKLSSERTISWKSSIIIGSIMLWGHFSDSEIRSLVKVNGIVKKELDVEIFCRKNLASNINKPSSKTMTKKDMSKWPSQSQDLNPLIR